ncbi:MAG: sterol desaturase family protein [Methylococcaceae bacterium]|nr:sterol desaturase family protein [Methylococcaceae bacterium]
MLTVFAVLFTLEALWGYRQQPAKMIRRSYLTNLGTFLLNDTLMSLLSVSSLLMLAERFGHWGLLHSMEDSIGKTLLPFFLLDLTLYLWHRVNHRFAWLWMFHKVHHSDRSMNVTTAFRLHLVEVLLTTVIKGIFIVVVGVSTAIVLVNELVITLFVMFHHANLSFKGESEFGRLLIMPSLHRVHHSSVREEHDKNFGAVFSCWDRLFGSWAELEPQEIGLSNVEALSFMELLKFGFSFNYPSTAPLPGLPALNAMIAEAAYYRAEKRGFASGYEFCDWLEAEKEILARFRGVHRSRQNKPNGWRIFMPPASLARGAV